MGVAHGGADGLIAQELLDGASTLPPIQQVVHVGIAMGWRRDAHLDHGPFLSVLQQARCRVGNPPSQGTGQQHPAPDRQQVLGRCQPVTHSRSSPWDWSCGH
jgi:hypothetical protein